MKIKHLEQYFAGKQSGIVTLFILVLGATLRFYDYLNRFGIGYDQTHDAIISRYALEHYLIPLVGPFSSAGPFQTGGEWYWFIMAGASLLPFSPISPWIFMTLIHIAFIYLTIIVGKKIIDKPFGYIAGFFAAISTAQIAQSTNLTNQGPQAIPALLAIFSAIVWIREKKTISLFCLGFFVSLGMSIHMQAAALLSLIPITIILGGMKYLKPGLIMSLIIGLVIPHIPLLLFDFQNDFVNLQGMIQYFLYDQYKISFEVLGRRWLTYAFVFWPNAWSHIIGGQMVISFATIIGIGLMFTYKLIAKKMNRVFLFLISSFFIMVIILRYIRAPLFDSYLVFLNPFVVFLSAWLVYFLLKKKKALGIIAFLVIASGSLIKDFSEITHKGNMVTRLMIQNWRSALLEQYPDNKFSFYDYKFESKNISFPFVYFMYAEDKIDDDAIKIGVALVSKVDEFPFEKISDGSGGYQVFVLNGLQKDLEQEGWRKINPDYVYNSVERWRQ